MKRKEIMSKAMNAVRKQARDFNFQCDWCALFIDWLFGNETPFTGNAIASCTAQRSVWVSIGEWHNKNEIANIEVGDVLYYDWDNSGDCDHVGIVVNRQGNKISVIEGNSGSGHWSNTEVAIRVIDTSYSYIAGYATPDYDDSANILTTTNTLDIERQGTLYSTDMVNTCYAKVEQIQNMLNVVNNSGITCDGYFGNKTKQAVIDFQKKYNLEIDGIVGKETITKLCQLYFKV